MKKYNTYKQLALAIYRLFMVRSIDLSAAIETSIEGASTNCIRMKKCLSSVKRTGMKVMFAILRCVIYRQSNRLLII